MNAETLTGIGAALGLATRKSIAEATRELRADVERLLARVAELETRPALKYYGIHKSGDGYPSQSVVTYRGDLWIARAATTATPGAGETPWQLAVRRGRDGRDRRGEE